MCISACLSARVREDMFDFHALHLCVEQYNSSFIARGGSGLGRSAVQIPDIGSPDMSCLPSDRATRTP